MPTRWPFAARQQSVDRANAERKRLRHAFARERGGGAAMICARVLAKIAALAVDRTAQAVEHAPEQMIGHADFQRLAERDDFAARADARADRPAA